MENKSDRKKLFYNATLYILFGVYLIFLAWRVFFYAYGNYHRAVIDSINYNIVPFKTITDYWKSYKRIDFNEWFFNLFGNVIAFIPFGFFTTAIFIRRFRVIKITMIGFVASLMVEQWSVPAKLDT